MFRRIKLVFSDKDLRTKILKILGLLIVARLLTHIPLPTIGVQDLSGFISENEVFGLLDVISGGGYGSLSIVMLGISPYITASIVFQLLGVIVPKINYIKKEEGEQGRQKINKWTRWLTVPLAALNAWGILRYLSTSGDYLPDSFSADISDPAYFWSWFSAIVALTAGSIIMMWIGEIITEYKMGNGISLIIAAGIVSKLPSKIKAQSGDVADNFGDFFSGLSDKGYFNFSYWGEFFTSSDYTSARGALILIVSFLATLMFVVFVNDSVRKLRVVYSRRGHGEGNSRTLSRVKADLPIKVNVAGVIPIIFAVSFILFPTIIATFLSTSNLDSVSDKAESIQTFLSTDKKTDELGEYIQEPDSIKDDGVLGMYVVDSEAELLAAKGYDSRVGRELFGFTFNNFDTNCNYQAADSGNLTGEDQMMIDYKDQTRTTIWGKKFDCSSDRSLSFLPEFGIHWNGISAYNLFYFILVVFFTYFYTSTVAFKTEDVAENLQKSGAYIPGYRPGKETEEYLTYISNRLNIVGSLFLAIIALFPIVMSQSVDLGASGVLSSVIGGTSLLILVSVAMESLRQIDAQATAVDYERFTSY